MGKIEAMFRMRGNALPPFKPFTTPAPSRLLLDSIHELIHVDLERSKLSEFRTF